jgi:hypothetical protein
MRHCRFYTGFIAALLMLLPAGSLFSQYKVKAGVFGCGAGVTMGTDARIVGTAGQVLAGLSEGQNHRVLAGFWYLQNSLSSSVETDKENFPVEFRLEQNYPNPFNPATTIAFSLPRASPVRLEIYNLLGESLKTLIADQSYQPGIWKVLWDGRDRSGIAVSSGFYIYRMIAGEYVKTRKMMLVK